MLKKKLQCFLNKYLISDSSKNIFFKNIYIKNNLNKNTIGDKNLKTTFRKKHSNIIL